VAARRRRFVDLSAPIDSSPPDLPDPAAHGHRDRQDHAQGAAAIEALLKVPARLLRDGEVGPSRASRNFGTHNSTHVDAPWHYNSTVGRRARAPTIDELAARLGFFAPGGRARHDAQRPKRP
jgi:kynurenine formamidase